MLSRRWRPRATRKLLNGRLLSRLANTCTTSTRNSSSSSSSTTTSTTATNGISVDALARWCISMGLLALLGEAYLRTDVSDSENPDECSYAATTDLIRSHHVRTLEEEGIVVIPNALSHLSLRATRQDLVSLMLLSSSESNNENNNSSGEAAVIVGRAANDEDVRFRQDQVAWVSSASSSSATTTRSSSGDLGNTNVTNTVKINGKDTNIGLGDPMDHCIQLIRGVTHALEGHRYPSNNNSKSQQQQQQQQQPATVKYYIPRQCQLAWYPGDGAALYKRHLDRCQKTLWELGLLEWLRLSDYRERSLTVILYLNEADRPKQHGGALRCWVAKQHQQQHPSSLSNSKTNNTHDNDKNGSDIDNDHGSSLFYPPFDVQPTGGTMVIFQSDKVEHMVLPSMVDRYALTSWVARVPGT